MKHFKCLSAWTVSVGFFWSLNLLAAQNRATEGYIVTIPGVAESIELTHTSPINPPREVSPGVYETGSGPLAKDLIIDTPTLAFKVAAGGIVSFGENNRVALIWIGGTSSRLVLPSYETQNFYWISFYPSGRVSSVTPRGGDQWVSSSRGRFKVAGDDLTFFEDGSVRQLKLKEPQNIELPDRSKIQIELTLTFSKPNVIGSFFMKRGVLPVACSGLTAESTKRPGWYRLDAKGAVTHAKFNDELLWSFEKKTWRSREAEAQGCSLKSERSIEMLPQPARHEGLRILAPLPLDESANDLCEKMGFKRDLFGERNAIVPGVTLKKDESLYDMRQDQVVKHAAGSVVSLLSRLYCNVYGTPKDPLKF